MTCTVGMLEEIELADGSLLRAALAERQRWRNRRVVLHAGTPKTGTTSLQYSLDEHRIYLQQQGIVYPTCTQGRFEVPKHQWIIQTLIQNDEAAFTERLLKCLDESNSETDTIFLSTEGIYNHWSLLLADGKRWLTVLSEFFNFGCILWFREPLDFCRSAYVQCLINSRVPYAEHYGRDLSVVEMLAIPNFASLLAYESTLTDMRTFMGEHNVFAFAYAEDILTSWTDLFGVQMAATCPTRRNSRALSAEAIRSLRKLNRLDLGHIERHAACGKILECDALSPNRPRFTIDPETADRIVAICRATPQSLAIMNDASVARWRLRYAA